MGVSGYSQSGQAASCVPGTETGQHDHSRGRAVINRVKNSCALEELIAFDSISIGDVTQPDALQHPDVQQALAQSQLGTTAPAVPAYIYYGSADTIVPPALQPTALPRRVPTGR